MIPNLCNEHGLSDSAVSNLVNRAKDELNESVSTKHVCGVIKYLTNENIVDILSLETLINECECPVRKAKRIIRVIKKVNQYLS